MAGEPGVGKTRLASEVAALLAADGAMVLLGRCPEETVVGYQPFAEAFRYAASSLGSELAAVAGERAVAELARIVPDICELVGELPDPFRGEPDAERFALFEAVARVMRGLATAAPLVLVLDDLHWADPASLSLVRHLVGHQESVPAFAIATYRDTEVRRTHALAELLADLRRRGSIDRVDLSGIDADAVAGVLESLAGHELDDDGRRLAALLHRETEGNPFFLGEIVRHLVETGQLRERGGRWSADRDVRQLPIPEGVKEVVGRRLSRLPEQANRVLAVASVLGREFDANLLADLTDSPVEVVVQELETALAASLLDEVPGALERYSFSHALVRETLHDELSTSRRVRLHQRAADVLERRGASNGDLARHLREAAPAVGADRAANACLAAAHDAIAAAAAEEAIAHCAAAVALLDDEDTGPSRLRFDLALLAGDGWYRLGDLSMAKPMFESALAQARVLGDPELVAHAVFERYGRIPTESPGDWRERRSIQMEALAALPDEDSPGRAKLLSLVATTVMQYLEDPNGPKLSQEGLAVARRCGDPLALGFALWVAQAYLSPSPDIEARLALTQEAVASIATSGHVTGMWQTSEARGALLFEAGRIDDVRAYVAELSRSAQELKIPFLRLSIAYWDFLFATLVGDLTAAHAADSAATDIAATSFLAGESLFAGVRAFALAREGGTLEALVPAIEMFADAFPNLLAWRAALAWSYAELGQMAEARAAMVSVVEAGLDPVPFDPMTWLVGCVLLADLSSWLDEPEWAAAIENQLAPHTGHVAHVGWAEDCWGSVDHHLGRLSLVRGRLDEAEIRFRAALELEERIGAVVWAARTREQLAVAVEARGDATEARALREAALAVAERVPSPRLVERLRSALD